MLSLGSNISATQVVESKYSANFDGTDEYIDTGQTFQSVFRGDYSISFWMKPDDGRCSEMVFGADNDSNDDGNSGGKAEIYFQLQGDGAPRLIMTAKSDVGVWSTNGGGGFNFDDGAASSWTHFVITVDLQSSGDTVVKIYVNGVDKTNEENGIASSNHDDYTSDVSLVLGGRNIEGTVSDFYGGGLDEFAIFNTVLGTNEPLAIYNNTSPLNLSFNQGNYVSSSALQVYYRMGDGLFDDKANGIVHDQDNPGFGAEEVVNGDFASDSDWTKSSSGVTISGGSANFNLASDTYVYQDILTATKTYKIIFSGAINSGSLYIGENGVATNTYTAGTYTNEVAYFTVASSSRFIIRKTGVGTLDATIDNISVKQLNGNPGITSGGPTFSSDTP